MVIEVNFECFPQGVLSQSGLDTVGVGTFSVMFRRKSSRSQEDVAVKVGEHLEGPVEQRKDEKQKKS
jgi:hypothetical protein